MSARKRIWTPEVVRQRIKTSMVLKRLQDHVLDPEAKKMSVTQLKGAIFLLSRMVPTPTEAQDLNINGNLTYVFRNPTARPPEMTQGHHRTHVNGNGAAES
jgi:hypothetical protein